jgi:hypothetical protein
MGDLPARLDRWLITCKDLEIGDARFRGGATTYRTTDGFRLRGCRGKEDERDWRVGVAGILHVGVAGNSGMIWRAKDAVRARKMNGRR